MDIIIISSQLVIAIKFSWKKINLCQTTIIHTRRTRKEKHILSFDFEWNNSPWIHMLSYPDTLSWFRTNQSFLFLREATNTNFTVFGFIRPGLELTIYRTRGEHTTITPLMWLGTSRFASHKNIFVIGMIFSCRTKCQVCVKQQSLRIWAYMMSTNFDIDLHLYKTRIILTFLFIWI